LYINFYNQTMSSHKRINPFSKQNNDTGFASNTNDVGGRFINKDGTYNLRKEGFSFFKRFSLFQDMLSLPLWRFIMVIFIFYLGVNIVFTAIYLAIGQQQLTGIIGHSYWKIAREVFYFSTETFTTVGYGRVNPVGDAANIVSSVESLTGFLSLAIATGLIYGRFSKPRGYLAFSEHALVSP
jgi:inward rectifier potassium channel